VSGEYLLMCIAASSVQLQTRMGTGVWLQFILEVSQSTELLNCQVARNHWPTKNFHKILESRPTCSVVCLKGLPITVFQDKFLEAVASNPVELAVFW